MALISSLLVMLFKLVVLFHPLLLLSNHHPFVNSVQPFCHDKERSALIHFNQSFKIDCQPRVNINHQSVPIYPKTSTWGSNGTNCCAWDGVECNLVTGHVTGLNLKGSCLHGTVHSNNTLFHLVHLQKLHLGYNNFTFSPIPTTVAIFSELTFLHLGYSFFQGEIPSEVSVLSKLSYLSMSSNVDDNDQPLSSLKLEKINLGSLAKNLTTLTTLVLNYVDMRYELGDSLANLSSSLTVLQLWDCGLYGPIPSSIGILNQLNFINLNYNSFAGYIPSFFQNLTLLSTISLRLNQISGPIPSWFGNLTELKSMDISSNNLTGLVPPSLSNLKNLEYLHLSKNSLSGTLKFDSFLKLKNLYAVDLGYNMISLLLNDERKRELNTTLPKLELLDLASCNLSRFPDFIVHQNNLACLDLSDNNIYGPIPKDLMNSSLQSLEAMALSYNWITGFQNYTTIPWSNLRVFEMQSNLLQGQLLIPPSSIIHYDVSNNILSGQIPSSICNLSSILVLELSNNNFSGEFPLCWGSGISESILVLNLRNNSFHGTIPLQCQLESKLRMVDFSHNHFQGKLQPPFTICMDLEYLDFSFNQLSDVFPTWLGSFPQLRVVLMRENKFHGVIGNPQNTTSEFAMLQIIDLSHNYFTGAIPFEYMFSWNSMKAFKMSNLTYMKARETLTYNNSYAIGLAVTSHWL
ncbi:receptor-like protein 6 isoform X1 [Cannabis sativa]|uniref:receptor-like protein 6 isoform X1 n=1 Tax=Cannabis sativa TaxID=3483 RepID=UPI0029CA0E04|nr:receptor-like protein 6 isoform X1 [Cannabis sativa]